jgi:phospho-N-acetylmuramoyl-pentapeptide-transferase
MQGILLATAVAMVVALLGTPIVVDFFLRRGVGQQVRVEGPALHLVKQAAPSSALLKQGTPTMGGLVLLVASTIGYVGAHIRVDGGVRFRAFSVPALLVLGATWALGALGAVDDYVSIRRTRSLGLNPRAKLIGQTLVGFALAYGAMRWVGVPPRISWAGSGVAFVPQLPQAAFAIWVVVVISGMSNAVNITDGLDGLATGSSAMALFVFVVIAFWEFRHPDFYEQLHPLRPNGLLDVAIVAAALLGACVGFLWWNAAPARIIMGDTGGLGLGGALAALALFTRTQVLLAIIGGLFLVEFASSMIQIISFRYFGRRRVFAMAPIHHHFEMKGWNEITVTVRFWLIAGLFAGLGLAVFYTAFITAGGVD